MFEKKVWNDRQSEHPARRRLTPTGNDNEYEVSRAEGTVMEEGDAFDAATMNDLENRVAKAFAEYDPAELGAVNVTVQLYTCKKEGKVYQLTGSGAVGRCKIPAAWASGDTWTVNGTTVPAYCGADKVDGDTIVAGRWVLFTFDGQQLNFNGGGGLTSNKLAQATATEADVLANKKFFAKNKTLRTGRIVDRGQYQYGSVGAGSDYVAINSLPEGWYHSGGASWAPEARAKFSEFGTAPASALLSGYNMTSAAGLRVAGGMQNNGDWNAQIAPGGVVTVPPGCHSGKGAVSARKAAVSLFEIFRDNGAAAWLDRSYTITDVHALVIILYSYNNGNIDNVPTVSSGTITALGDLNCHYYSDGSPWANVAKAFIVNGIEGSCTLRITSSNWNWGFGFAIFKIN